MRITDLEVMSLIRSNRENCMFTRVELTAWLVSWGMNKEAARKLCARLIARLPVESLSVKYFKLTIIPEIKETGKQKKQQQPKKEFGQIAKEVIEHLNLRTGSRYSGKASDLTKIKARLEEKFTLQDLKTVVDKKSAEWMGTEWEKFLRPETLFGAKFESYLNQSGALKKTTKVEEMTKYSFEKYLPGGRE